MKTNLFILIGLFSQFVFAGKDIRQIGNGFTQEKYYKYEGNACYLVTDTYRRGNDIFDQKPILQDLVDSGECLASFNMKGKECQAFDRLGNMTSVVDQKFCNPSQESRNGWYIVAENLKGSLQLTIPTGNYLFQGGKEPTLEVVHQDDLICKITLFEKDAADRVLRARILRLSDIQVQVRDSMAYFSFNSFSETSVDGKQLEPVKNITCGVRDGFRSADGSKFDVKQSKSFSIQSIFELTKAIQFPVSKKPATDI